MRIRLGDSRAKSKCRRLRNTRKRIQVAVRAGDILLATVPPRGLSARNVLEGAFFPLSSADSGHCARGLWVIHCPRNTRPSAHSS